MMMMMMMMTTTTTCFFEVLTLSMTLQLKLLVKDASIETFGRVSIRTFEMPKVFVFCIAFSQHTLAEGPKPASPSFAAFDALNSEVLTVAWKAHGRPCLQNFGSFYMI